MWMLAKKSVTAWSNDYASSMGAAIAYYTLFSLAPLLLLVIAVAGVAYGAQAARGAVLAQLSGLIGKEGATAVEALLKSASHPARNVIATAVSIVTLIIGATSVFAELQSDLDRIWRAPASSRPAGIMGLLRTRLLSFGLIVSFGFLLLVSLVVSTALAAFAKWYGAWFPGWIVTVEVVNQVVSVVFVTALFALMYRILPSVRVAWRDVWRGALATAVLFTIGKFLIGFYLGKAGVATGFGAAGSIVVLLVWVFYSAQIFLLGAEFTWLYAHERGSRAAERASGSVAASAETESVESDRQPRDTTAGSAPAAPLRKSARTTTSDAAATVLAWATFGAVRTLIGRWRGA